MLQQAHSPRADSPFRLAARVCLALARVFGPVRWLPAAMAALLLLPGAVHAAPYLFTFKTLIGTSAIPGVSVGDTIIVEVVADNGGTTAISQTWSSLQVTSASASVGTYQATYIAPFFASPTTFATDAGGLVSTANFFDVGFNNQDVFGTGGFVAFGSDAVRDFNGNLANFLGCAAPPGTGANCANDAALWSVSAVPLPAAAWLFASALAGLLGLAAKRHT